MMDCFKIKRSSEIAINEDKCWLVRLDWEEDESEYGMEEDEGLL